MYEAIVVLPLIGAVIAGAISLIGARNRFRARIRRLRTTITLLRSVPRTIIHARAAPQAAHAEFAIRRMERKTLPSRLPVRARPS